MRPTNAYIDTDAVKHNIAVISQHAPNKKILAMIKSNAYGCGVEIIAPILSQLPSVYGFGVASIDEAIQIRKIGLHNPILLCEGVFESDEYSLVRQYNLECVIHSKYQLDWLLEEQHNDSIRIWLKINSGMNRLGIPIDKIPSFIEKLKNYNKPILMTHLACADEPYNDNNLQQLKKIYEIYNKFSNYEWSLDNSCGVFNELSENMDIVRPGIAIYGVSPYKDKTARELNLKPVMNLKARIIALQHLNKGDCVGYGLKWQAKRPTRLGIVSIGYGDGYPRGVDQFAVVSVRSKNCPIVGRVSMDMITIDITDHKTAEIGDEVELWGSNIPIELIAKSCGTIGYELLCQVTSRVNRVKIKGKK
jgi:alanine racemase